MAQLRTLLSRIELIRRVLAANERARVEKDLRRERRRAWKQVQFLP
jgi:hypothetical protein